MAWSGLAWLWLVLALVLVLGSDERPDLTQDEDLLHPSSIDDFETWGVSNTDWDPNRDRTRDQTRDQTTEQTRDQTDNSSGCGGFESEITPDGLCRIRAVLPAMSGASPRERCPDMFRCRTETADWLREAGNRKQQLQQVQEALGEMRHEVKETQRRLKHLQSEGQVTVNSSLIGRLMALEARHTEVSTLLHVHAALMHDLQTQLQNLSRSLQSTCTTTRMRTTSATINIMRPAPPVVSSCPSDCASLIHSGVHRSGIYSIIMAPGVSLPVYCDMETDGGGWTVFQRRRDGSVNFNRGWDEYSSGFGDLRSEHWLGNTPLHLLVTQRHCSLRIHLLDWTHVHHTALYDHFSIESEQGRFRLHVSGFSGSVSDSFGWYHDGQDFVTPDSGHLCAEVCHSGWWFRHCYQANLNGVYYQGGLYSLRAQNLLGPDGLVWFSWRDSDFYSLKATAMMIRPRDFRTPRSP